MRSLIGVALRRRGYAEDDTNPGFLVRFGSSTQRMRARGFDVTDEMRASDDDGYADFREIRLDVFDVSTKAAVWRSSTVSKVHLDEPIDDRLLQDDVGKLLASFPARPVAVDQCGTPLAKPTPSGATRKGVAPNVTANPDASDLSPGEVRVE